MTTAVVSPADRLVTVPSGIPALTLGWEVVHWATKYLRQPNGPAAGQRWQFLDSQVRFLLWWYALDEDGRWLYNHGVRRLAKGSGKSPFAAVMALAELCAPVRLADFDPKRPGGVRGRPVDMPLVQIAATAESQTANTMRMVRAFAPKASRIVAEFDLDPGKTQYYKQPDGKLEVITSSMTAAEGAEASFIVADETEHWTSSNGGPDLMTTLLDNLAKSGSRAMETANSWVPGIGSVAEASYDTWVLQEEGKTRGSGATLYDARVASPDVQLTNEKSLRAALGHVYGDCWWVDLDFILARVWDPKSSPDNSRRKYLNQPTASTDAWVTPQQWARLADPTIVVADGDDIVLFFDGSKSRDATALVGCRLSDGHVFCLGVWEPRPTHDDTDTVDAADVDRAVRLAMDKYTVVAFFADVREWESFVLTEWPGRYGEDLQLHSAPRARPPQAIAWDMRSHKDEFARAVEACYAEILEGAFTHDGDSRIGRHVVNARRRPYKDMVSIGKESASSPRKIDGAVCVVGARMVRRMVLGAGLDRKKRSGVVW